MNKLSFKDSYFFTTHNITNRQVEEITGIGKSTASYCNKKYGLQSLQKYKKNDKFVFGKIDTKEKAYTLGFILADGSIDIKNIIDIKISIQDKEVLEFIGDVVNSNIFDDMTFNRKARRFPSSRINKKIPDITKFTGGRLKEERHFPRIRKDLEPYLLQGFFDGDGCITWGRRKDRNRLWQKVSFTSQLKLLEGVQQYLYKNNISTVIYPKNGEGCYLLQICNKEDVLKMYNLIYSDKDFIILRRKFVKFNALRLELEENGEGSEKLR